MKKILFNNQYGLTKAVLEGRKTMTRRVMNPQPSWVSGDGYIFNDSKPPQFKVGEVVAVAQPYEAFMCHEELCERGLLTSAAAHNSMFVKADLMPHHIRITNVRVERLQDISDEDCRKEGIDYVGGYSESYYFGHGVGNIRLGNSYREAFAALIDKVSGKGTWESNPWVFAYEFELI